MSPFEADAGEDHKNVTNVVCIVKYVDEKKLLFALIQAIDLEFQAGSGR